MVCLCCCGGGWRYCVAMVDRWWLAVLGCCDGRLLLLLGIEEWVREGLIRQERGERKKYKIIYRRAIVTVQIYTITVAHGNF